jgi:hypothetical protein
MIALAVSATVVLGLAACAPEDRPLPSESATPSSPSSPSASPSTTPTAEPGGAAIDVSCSQLVSDEVVYEWGSGNFALDPTYVPAPGSSAASAVAADGVACGWVNLTSGVTVAISAANLSADALATVTSDLAANSAAAPGLGAGGYFATNGGVGRADVLDGSLWINAESVWFAEVADAKDLVSAAVAAVG